jgi:hypothetical protein
MSDDLETTGPVGRLLAPAQGVFTEAEFVQQKSRILST